MIFLSPPIDPVIPGIQSYQLWQRARVSRERLGSSERPNMLEGREPDTESAKWKQKHHWSNPLSDLSTDWSTRLRGSSESRSEPRSWPPPPFMPCTRIAIDSFYSRRLDQRWIVLLKKTMDQSACLVLVDWLPLLTFSLCAESGDSRDSTSRHCSLLSPTCTRYKSEVSRVT